MRIIYPNENGGICLIIPADVLPIEEVAKKDVPAGVKYKILEDNQVPEDHTFFDAWEFDFSDYDGIGMGADAWFAANPQPVIDTPTPIEPQGNE